MFVFTWETQRTSETESTVHVPTGISPRCSGSTGRHRVLSTGSQVQMVPPVATSPRDHYQWHPLKSRLFSLRAPVEGGREGDIPRHQHLFCGGLFQFVGESTYIHKVEHENFWRNRILAAKVCPERSHSAKRRDPPLILNCVHLVCRQAFLHPVPCSLSLAGFCISFQLHVLC